MVQVQDQASAKSYYLILDKKWRQMALKMDSIGFKPFLHAYFNMTKSWLTVQDHILLSVTMTLFSHSLTNPSFISLLHVSGSTAGFELKHCPNSGNPGRLWHGPFRIQLSLLALRTAGSAGTSQY